MKMRIFISYARLDQMVCQRIIDLLEEGYQVWYDKHIDIGEKWLKVIINRILWADAFVFLISPRSLASEFCKKEFRIAMQKGKKIFPILIEPVEHLPAPLCDYHYVDMCRKDDSPDGMTVENSFQLNNALLRFERQLWEERFKQLQADVKGSLDDASQAPVSEALDDEAPGDEALDDEALDDEALDDEALDDEALDSQTCIFFEDEHKEDDASTLIKKIVKAMTREDYENAIYRIDEALRRGWQWEMYDLTTMRDTALKLFHEQQYLVEAGAQYEHIKNLASRDKMLPLAASAYQTFCQLYPEYPDPDGLAFRLQSLTDPIPHLVWCTVTEGQVGIVYDNKRYLQPVETFRISKYPITNAQYHIFLYAEDGYANSKWWGFSKEACEWRMNHPKPTASRDMAGDHPRVHLSWYEARAFCNWLGHHLQAYVTLPTEAEWQRAAQGDDNRLYPWGKMYDSARCNGRDGKINRVTSVKRFPGGDSPFGVSGMSGNIWEWTLSADEKSSIRVDLPSGVPYRIAKGGSYSSKYELLRCTSRLPLDPESHFGTIGFRVILKPRSIFS